LSELKKKILKGSRREIFLLCFSDHLASASCSALRALLSAAHRAAQSFPGFRRHVAAGLFITSLEGYFIFRVFFRVGGHIFFLFRVSRCFRSSSVWVATFSFFFRVSRYFRYSSVWAATLSGGWTVFSGRHFGC
jgi:hypothetical protein